jgi:hypothetical protein
VVAAPEPTLSPEEEKMHLESLLNYVAFNRKDPQRTFLPDEAPPPPPPKPLPTKKPDGTKIEAPAAAAPPTAVAESVPSFDSGSLVTGDEAAKANAEAQMVLGGAIKFRRVDVATNLYDKLIQSQVEISEKTFALMIESCVLASDLKNASDFLLKMEASGHSPETELLDKVMDLYSQVKTTKRENKKANHGTYEDSTARSAGFAESPDRIVNAESSKGRTPLRTKLSSAANTFIPGVPSADWGMSSFGGLDFSPSGIDFQPMGPAVAPPPDQPGELSGDPGLMPPNMIMISGSDDTDALANGNGTVSAAEVPQATPNMDTLFTVPRTALKATSLAFQPQGMVTFNPGEHTWTVMPQDIQPELQGEDQAKGKGKNGRQAKEKAPRKEKAEKEKAEKPPRKEKAEKADKESPKKDSEKPGKAEKSAKDRKA